MSDIAAESSSETAMVAVTKSPPKRHPQWAWDKRKSKAVDLTLKGASVRAIAQELGVHWNTVQTWRSHPEFQQRLARLAREYAQTTRFRRVHETGVFTSAISRQLVKVLDRLENAAESVPQDVHLLQVFLREFRAMRQCESQDFGDNVQRYEGAIHVHGLGSEASRPMGSQEETFERFLDRAEVKVDRKVIDSAATPQEALQALIEQVIEGTDLVDQVQEEDLAQAESEKKG